jgi:hypothetical protein
MLRKYGGVYPLALIGLALAVPLVMGFGGLFLGWGD